MKQVNVFFRTYQVDTDGSLFVDEQIESSTFVYRDRDSVQA
jgi:hypothetical protein